MLAVVAAAVAVVVKRRAFPHLSINNDEAINAFFADTLARGRMFAPTMGDPDAFRPWLAATSGDHYVLKYTPVIPALVAASLVLTGGPGLFLAAVAAGNVGITYLLAKEVLGDPAEALVATVLVAPSPLVLLHSALLLSYLPTFALLQGFAWAVLRGVSRDRPRLLGLGGLALGLAAFIRPFDALVFATPVLAWAALQWWRRRLPVRPQRPGRLRHRAGRRGPRRPAPLPRAHAVPPPLRRHRPAALDRADVGPAGPAAPRVR